MQIDGRRILFTDENLKRVREFARYPHTTLDQHLFQIAKNTETFVYVFELYLRTIYAQYFSQISSVERAICELISLHKLQGEFSQPFASDKQKCASGILTTMLQQRLTYFFLNLDPQHAMRIHQLGNEQGMREVAWKEVVVNAVSCARTITNFLAVSNCYAFLPTIEESLNHDVDLIIITDQHENWCVRVQPGAINGDFYVEHVSNRPDPSFTDVSNMTRREIYNGAKQMTHSYSEQFLACRIIVGKTNGDPVDLTLYPKDKVRLTTFITRKRPQGKAQKDEAA